MVHVGSVPRRRSEHAEKAALRRPLPLEAPAAGRRPTALGRPLPVPQSDAVEAAPGDDNAKDEQLC